MSLVKTELKVKGAIRKATGGTFSNVGDHRDGETVPPPRLEWGVGMRNKSIRTALCPGGSERMGRLMRLIQTKVDGMNKPLIAN